MSLQWIFFLFLFSSISLNAAEISSDEEGLFARRIVEFWNNRDDAYAKMEIEEFLRLYPESTYRDDFYSIYGELAIAEERFEDAIEIFEKITSEAVQERISPRRFYCLYQLKRYAKLIVEISPLVQNDVSDELLFYYAEALLREKIYERARPFYEKLLTTGAYQNHAMLALAEIFRLTGNAERASEFYLTLADRLQKSDACLHEELLFSAALMLAHFDVEKSIASFAHLAEAGLRKNREAAFQWMQLLVKEKRFDALLDHSDKILSTLPDDKIPQGHFYCAQAHFQKNNYPLAQAHLEAVLTRDPHPEALLMTLCIAKEIGDLPSLEKSYSLFCKLHPKDPLFGEALYLRALGYQNAGEESKALSAWDELLNTPCLISKESAYLEKAKLLFRQKSFDLGHSVCAECLNVSPQCTEARRLSIACLLHELTESENKKALYQQLIDELELALTTQGVIKQEERPEELLTLAKAYFCLDDTQKALFLLASIAGQFTEPSRLAEFHRLCALCHLKKEDSPEKWIPHAEAALEYNPDLDEKRLFQLHLFHAFLESGEEEKAAEYLFGAVKEFPEESLPADTLFWLADFFFKKAEKIQGTSNALAEHAGKAIFLYEKSFAFNASNFSFQESLLVNDREALNLAHLYQWTGALEKKRQLLELLGNAFIKYPDRAWNSIGKAKLELADLYLSQEEKEKARMLLEELESSHDLSVVYSARLKLARLLFALLPEQEKRSDSEAFQAILKRLHDLEVRRTLATEPLHLEAAIDYAEIAASLEPKGKKEAILLSNLSHVRQEFSATDDIWSKDYHASRELMPEKERIYQAYMRLIDAKILHLEALIAKSQGNRSEEKSKEKAARALFASLRKGKYAVTSYIVEKALGESQKR